MDREAAETAATRVGYATLAIGLLLMARPAPAAQMLGGADQTTLRVIAAFDLALVPGLIRGRHPVRWMVSRVVLNLGIAACCASLAREHGALGARAGVGLMIVASVADVRTLLALRQP